ncbi:conserved protein of unknown function [Xenorhabdus poinarii G6]|uniref:Uncharacterized protein n=1 Tax=Xenorhabdus poinarii G6 TaxID=1354304 RepID=A0A068R6P4_9GAMM|nr:conserved protein of unknown function [Xenorhabdus poinarii G6]
MSLVRVQLEEPSILKNLISFANQVFLHPKERKGQIISNQTIIVIFGFDKLKSPVNMRPVLKEFLHSSVGRTADC